MFLEKGAELNKASKYKASKRLWGKHEKIRLLGGVSQGCVALLFYCKSEGNMRLDKYLKVSRLIKRRTVANEACDAGRVLINDKPAKASVNVKVGDIIAIQFGNKEVKVEVLDVQETVKKDEAKELFRYL